MIACAPQLHRVRLFLLEAQALLLLPITVSASVEQPKLSIRSGNMIGAYYAAASAVAKVFNRTGPDTLPPLRTYHQIVRDGEADPLNAQDAIEGFNRGAYGFNCYLDNYFFCPIVRGYEFVLPPYARDRVSNALDNIGELANLTNILLQFNLDAVGLTLCRLLVNTLATRPALRSTRQHSASSAPSPGWTRSVSRPATPGSAPWTNTTGSPYNTGTPAPHLSTSCCGCCTAFEGIRRRPIEPQASQ